MTRRLLSIVLAVLFVIIGLSVFITRSNKPAVELGPKVAKWGNGAGADHEVDATVNRHIDDMRSWLESLSPEQAKQLQETGYLKFTYQQLKESDPKHAQFVAQCVEDTRLQSVERRRAAGRPIPPQVATPHDPETIEFFKTAPYAYKARIMNTAGRFEEISVSDPK